MGGVYAHVPIVALTANAVSGAKEMFLENSFNGYLSKPIDIPKLNAVLEKWIPKKKQKPAAKRAERPETAREVAIAGLNTKAGIARTGGSAEAYFRTLGIFRNDGREKVGEIKRCLEAGNLPLFTINVHALKGAAANVGALALSEAAKALEDAGKREDRVFIRENIGRLLSDLETLLRNIDEAISTEKKKSGQTQTGTDMESIKAALAGLSSAIADLDPDAINAAAGKLRRMGGGSKVETILQNTLIGEYDAAVSLIESLLKEAQ
jgi:HPt (histidine-containing phosphotransfer) domain-containing protein